MHHTIKILFILTAVLCWTCEIFAQQESDEIVINEHRKAYSLNYGPTIGIGLATGSDSKTYDLELNMGIAYRIGIAADIHFGYRDDSRPVGTGLLGAKAEIAYCGRMVNSDNGMLRMHCLEIPVMVQWYPLAILDEDFAIETGLTLVRMIKSAPQQMQFGNHVFQTGDLSGGDVMVSIGTSYRPQDKFLVEARYNIGLSSLAGNFDSRISTFMISATYLLNTNRHQQ